MRSFLLKKSQPVCKWGMIDEGIMYKGDIPEEFDLAVAPSPGYIIIDIDNKDSKCGYDSVPKHLIKELDTTFNYKTANNGSHHWFLYSGNKLLLNKTSGLGIDLRVGPTSDSNGGYVKWHPREDELPKTAEEKALKTSKEMNKWLEKLFSYV